MALSKERKKHLQALGLPDDKDTTERVRHFAIRSGLVMAELAELAGVNHSSLRVFLSGCYDRNGTPEGSSLEMRAALKLAMDRYEIADPLAASDAPHYDTAEYAQLRKSMWIALRNGTAALVDGAPGTQKTYTFMRVAREINASGEGRAIYVYARVNHSPLSFLIEACTEAGIPNRGQIDQLIRKLRFFLGRGRTLLVVDEGQHLSPSCLEVLRQLLDRPPYFGVVLGGSHELGARVAHWRMEQLYSRFRREHYLKGLSEAEAGRILSAELGRPLGPGELAAIVRLVTSKGERAGKPYNYISARKLFFAIEDAKAAVRESAMPSVADIAQKAEAIA